MVGLILNSILSLAEFDLMLDKTDIEHSKTSVVCNSKNYYV